MRHDYSMYATTKTTLQAESAFRKEWAKGLKVDVSSFALASVENADRDATACKGLTFPHNASKEQHVFSVEKRTFIRIRSRKDKPVRMIQPAVKVLVDPSDFDGRTLEQHRDKIAQLQAFHNVENPDYVDPPYRKNFRHDTEQSEGYNLLLSWIQAQKGQFHNDDESDDDNDY